MQHFRILLVDDDTEFLKILSAGMPPGFEVITTTSALEAARRCRAERWDAIVLDVEMPVKTGFQLFTELKAIRPECRYFFLTCLTDDSTYLRSLDFDPEDFLNKPISPARLAAAIQHRIRKSQGSGVIRFCGLEMDLESETVSIGNERIELTRKEQSILKTLLKAPEKKVRRELLEQSIWRDVSVSPNTLDTHLTNLRRKINGAGLGVHVDRERFVRLFGN